MIADRRCKNCEKEFTLFISWSKDLTKRGKFCSQDCFKSFRVKNPSLYLGGTFKKGHKTIVNPESIRRGEKNNK